MVPGNDDLGQQWPSSDNMKDVRVFRQVANGCPVPAHCQAASFFPRHDILYHADVHAVRLEHAFSVGGDPVAHVVPERPYAGHISRRREVNPPVAILRRKRRRGIGA